MLTKAENRSLTQRGDKYRQDSVSLRHSSHERERSGGLVIELRDDSWNRESRAVYQKDEEGTTVRSIAKQINEVTQKITATEGVERYLRRHPGLVETIEEAVEQVKVHFDDDADVRLDVERDPELGEESLWLKIVTSYEEAYDALDRLDEEWWLDVRASIRKRMGIDVEYE